MLIRGMRDIKTSDTEMSKTQFFNQGFLDRSMARLVCNDLHITVTLDHQSLDTVLYTIRDSDYVDCSQYMPGRLVTVRSL